MKVNTKIIFTTLILLAFSGFCFGQEMTPRQKQILEKLKQEEKAETEKRNQIEKQLGLDRKSAKQTKVKSKFFEKKGVGITTKNIAQKRNLSKYEKGGHIDCRKWITEIDDLSLKCNRNKLRDFIWQSWSEKNSGYITISGDSRDASATSHIFIEPDKNGKWCIVWRIVRFHAMGEPSIDDFPKITSVEFLGDKTQKDVWRIILKDKLGNSSFESWFHFYSKR